MALADGRILYEFEDYLAFLEGRPEHERWELVDGTLHMMAPPDASHQLIAGNIASWLQNAFRRAKSPYLAVTGVGVHATVAGARSAAIPDLVVIERPLPKGGFTDRPRLIVEVLSPSTRAFDLGWKKPFYLALPGLCAYVAVETIKPEIVVFEPQKGLRGRRITGLEAHLDLGFLGLSLELSTIYEDVLA